MRRFRIRSPLVIHETVDDEVVIVNLESGNYHSLTGTGARVWGVLERTATPEEIAGQLRATFEWGRAAEDAVKDLLAELEREGLIEPTDIEASDGDEPPPADRSPVPAAERVAFESPVLETFRDMRELILLDPVHEADEERGWPHERSPG